MSDIVLSKAVRSNLLSLQSTAELLGKTQERLATGKKVNSALDNPTNFFTASALNSRAADLARLLDSVGNAVQTIEEADTGITAITKLVETAQATARQALEAAATVTTSTTSAATVTGNVAITDDTEATTSGTTAINGDLITAGFTNGMELSITIGSNTVVIGFNNTGTAGVGQDAAIDLDGANNAPGGGDDAVGADLVGAINTAFGGTVAALDGTTNALVLTATNTTDTITVAAGTAKTALGGLADAGATSSVLSALTGTLEVTVGSGSAQPINLTGINSVGDLTTALGGLTGVTATINGSGFLEVTASNTTDSITLGGTDLSAFGSNLSTTPIAPGSTSSTSPNPKREELRTQFNELLTQIDQLAADTSFNGVNLLNGDSLKVIFNEDGSSSLSITGVTFNSAGLGISTLTAGDFDTNSSIETTLGELDSAISSLRTQASKFGANLSVVETRQNFTKETINTLETGAANLTLADTNEESANLLALQTRQQLSTIALSLASQADQNVLRLF